MAAIIQIRRDTATNWVTANPTLANGEMGYETDSRRMKVGNAVDDWNTLNYLTVDAVSIWGQINGVLSDQTDLQAEFDLKTDDVVFNAHTADTNIHFDKSTIAIKDLTDVLSTMSPADGEVLTYDGAFGEWRSTEPAAVPNDHTQLSNIGVNTHSQIDTHMSDGTIHYPQSAISITESQISDHGTYEPSFTKNTAFNKDFGTAVSTVCAGNDARLSDDRTPSAHNHVKADITDFSDGDYATAAQGALADTAVQPGDNVSVLTNDAGYISGVTNESIYDLSDVQENTGGSPAGTLDGQILAYNTVSNKYENVTPLTQGAISHTNIQDIGVNSHPVIDTFITDTTAHFVTVDAHIADPDIHFTHATIDHTQIANIGSNSHINIDQHLANDSVHLPNNAIQHALLLGVNGTIYNHNSIDFHINDDTIHVPETSIDHTVISNRGYYSHAAIDNHIDSIVAHANWLVAGQNQDFPNAPSVAGVGAIALGDGAFCGSSSDNAIAIGTGATVNISADFGIAIGTGTDIAPSAVKAIAIGYNVKAQGGFEVALGNEAIDSTNNVLRLIGLGTLTLEGERAQYVQPNYTTAALPFGYLGGTVYDTVVNQLKVWNGTAWANTAAGVAASDVSFDDTNTEYGTDNVQDAMEFQDDQIGLRETAATGVVEGGDVNIKSDTHIDVLAGSGEIVDGYTDRRAPTRTNVTWNSISNILIDMPDQIGIQIVYVDATGTILQTATRFTPTQRRNLIQLAFVFYEAGVITNIQRAGILSNEVGNTLYDWLYFTTPSNRSKGLGINPVTNNLEIWADSGEFLTPGANIELNITDPNILALPAIGGDVSPAPFDVYYSDGTKFLTNQVAIPEFYESAPGVATALIGNDATIHYVFRTLDNKINLQLGQTNYNDGKTARDSLGVDKSTHKFFIGSEVSLLSAQVYLSNNASDFNDTNIAGIVSAIGAGAGASGGVAVTDFLSLSDVIPTSYAGEANKSVIVDGSETGLSFVENGLGKLNWIFPYAEGPTFESQDVVKDGEYTMVANKQTTDRAAPTPTGTESFVYQGTSPTTSITAKQIIQGTRYTLAEDAFINGYRFYTVTGNDYIVYSVFDPLGARIFNERIRLTATITGWFEFSIEPVLGFVGDVFDLIVVESEPDPSPIIVATSYNYQTQQNETVPAVGEIRHATKTLDQLWINKTDNDAVDRSATLAGLVTGDIIELGAAGDRYSIQAPGTDFGTYYKFSVAPAATSATGVQTVNFETTTATPLTYVSDTDYYLPDPNIQGLFIADGLYADIVPDENAYGADILTQAAAISDDWDVLAHSGASGSGGGGSDTIIRDDLLGDGAITEALSANQGYILDQQDKAQDIVQADHAADSTIHYTQASISITESQISDLQPYLLDITGQPLGDLSDVTLPTPAVEDVVSWDGAEWVNSSLVFADLGELGDVTITTPVNDEVLTYNAGTWVNSTVPADADKVNSITAADPGSDKIVNMVSLTQAEYDALTPVVTTFYVIVG